MVVSARKLIDWETARTIGSRVAADGAPSAADRRRMVQDFAEVVPEAERLAEEFTGLAPGGYRSRAWVMSRSQWLQANLRGLETVVEPFAAKVLARRPASGLAGVRRHMMGAQVGGLLGYVSRRVLGQYDLFLPPEDEGLIYFVGSNVAGVERKYGFVPRDFRFWISLHEVSHRLQFGGVPWLRGYLAGLIDSYIATVEVDPRQLLETLRRGVVEARRGGLDWRGLGWVLVLMTPEQREIFRRMQAVMALLEGHGNFVMDRLARGRIAGAPVFRRRLQERRQSAGVERAFQKAIGLDVKVRQYDIGERFVAGVVDRAGMEGFALVWAAPANLPTLDEIARPDRWLSRMGLR